MSEKEETKQQDSGTIMQLLAELVEIAKALALAKIALRGKQAKRAVKTRVEAEGKYLRDMARDYGGAARKYAEEEATITQGRKTILSDYRDAVEDVDVYYDDLIGQKVKSSTDLETQWHASVGRQKRIEMEKKKKEKEIRGTPEYQQYIQEREAALAELDVIQQGIRSGTTSPEELLSIKVTLAAVEKKNPLHSYNVAMQAEQKKRSQLEYQMDSIDVQIEQLQQERQTKIDELTGTKENDLATIPKRSLWQMIRGKLAGLFVGANKYRQEIIQPFVQKKIEQAKQFVEAKASQTRKGTLEFLTGVIDGAAQKKSEIDHQIDKLDSDKEEGGKIINPEKTGQTPETMQPNAAPELA